MNTFIAEKTQSFSDSNRETTMKTKLILILLSFSYFAQAHVTYGEDSDCDYRISQHSLQDLVDLDETNIRITNEVVFY